MADVQYIYIVLDTGLWGSQSFCLPADFPHKFSHQTTVQN